MRKIYLLPSLALFTLLGTHARAQLVTEVFTTSQPFTVPAGVTELNIEVVGAGGSGGGNGTGGGGGGGYASGTFSVTPLSVISITIGAGGAGGTAGTTNAGGLIWATGGENGVSVPHPSVGGGGAPGAGMGGTINRTGGAGGGGYWTYFGGGGGGAAGALTNGFAGGNTIPWTGICLTPGGSPGLSGGAPGGNGGKGAGFTDNACNVTDPAANGENYGGGGGGGNGIGSTPGVGGNGYCRITYTPACSVNTGTTVAGLTITASAPTGDYQWINCATNLPIIGETGQSYTATTNGSYAVIIDTSGCIDTSACVTINTVGLANMDAASATSVYPNPFSDKLTITGAPAGAVYTLINARGQVSWKGRDINEASLNELESGLYLLHISHGSKMQTMQVVKQ